MPIHEGDYQDPEEKKITDREKYTPGKMLKIPTPDDFKTQKARDALYRLNAREAKATKSDSAADMGKKHEEERKAKPWVFKRGGFVQRSGMAKVHKGERVLTARQNTKMMRKRAVKAY